MTETITDILTRLDKTLSGFPGDATFSLMMQGGELRQHLSLEGSNHLRLAAMSDIPKVEAWMRALPVVGPCGGDWSIAGGKRRAFNSSKISREYRCTMMNLDISRPASRRIRTACEMISGAADRLAEVERNAGACGGAPLKWLIDGKKREERYVLARSAREAAWTYAALYVRDRKEVRNWHDTVAEILRVTQVHPEQDWRTARP